MLFLNLSCERNKIIEEEYFIQLYTDILLAEETISGSAFSKDMIIARMLSKYNTTLENYNATIDYYNKNSEQWDRFFAKAIASIEERQQIQPK